MSNETIKEFDITIKLRDDNVYDLYIDNEWAASRDSYEDILDDVRIEMKRSLVMSKMYNKNLFEKEYLCKWIDNHDRLYKEYDRLYKLEQCIYTISGFSLERLKDLFLAGYKLSTPIGNEKIALES